MSPTETTIECECRPCPNCDGQGETSSYVPGGYYTTRGLQREYLQTTTCSACHGTGKDTGDCAVHDPRPVDEPKGAFDPRWGITAAQLGIDDGDACDACNAGYHDELLIGPKKCACACHGSLNKPERSAA